MLHRIPVDHACLKSALDALLVNSRARPCGIYFVLAILLATILGRPTCAQSPSPTIDPAVLPASANRHVPRGAAQSQSVRFGRRPPQVGDRIEQAFSHEMQLTTKWRQGQEFVNTTSVSAKNSQRRVVSTALVHEGRTQAVLVRYLDAANERSSSEQQPADTPQTPLPVVGKTYRCQRDVHKLVITDELGNVPPPEELEIVNADMESVGRPSPLAEFLGGRTVAVGESISLPLDLADRLLGLQDKFGKLTRFDLALREVRAEDGAQCAVFQANIEAASNDSSQMRLFLNGPLVVQIDTCRAVQTALSGPIAMSESRGSYSASFQLISTGKLSMTIASTYRDAAR